MADRANNGGVRLSANAPAFIPGGNTPPGADTQEGDVLARLPPSHRQNLRGCFMSPSGELVAYYLGRLKSFNNRTGYGFVECAQSHGDWGCDVFIHKNQVHTPWHIGQPVEFALSINNRGQPQAVDVNWLPWLPEAPRALNVMTLGQRAAAAAAGRTASPPTTALPTGRPDDPLDAEAEAAAAGVIAEAGATSSSTAAASREPDVPAAGAEAAEGIAVPGSAAGASSPSSLAPSKNPSPAEQRWLGSLKSFSPAQGYGFIACEEVFQLYGRDTYLDRSQLPPTTWRNGMPVEFTCSFNGRGQPQARAINWEPVPQLDTEAATSAAAAAAGGSPEKAGSVAPAGGGSPGPRSLGAPAQEKLRNLLRLLHDLEYEAAVLTAIDLQGSHVDGAADADGHVDHVSFVLDRIDPDKESLSKIKDFVKMLLLIMVAKMLVKAHKSERCELLIRWFEATAHAIDPSGDVRAHFGETVGKISSHLQTAYKTNPSLQDDEAQANVLQQAFSHLQTMV